MKPFQILRTGTFTDMNGREVTFADGDLKAMAESYDPGLSEAPIVVGHPRHDAPAWGWVKAVSLVDGALVAEPHQVDEDFAAMVRDGKFKTRSAAIFLADAPNNPTPGRPYLRHVGFLGAMPPAVKGLKPVELADAEGITVVELGDVGDRRVASMFRRMRDFLIEKFGMEDADKVLPGWEVDLLQEDAIQPEPHAQPEPQASSSPLADAPQTHKEVPMPGEQDDARAADLARREEELKKREADLAAEAAALAEREVRTEAAAFAENLVKENRLPPGHKAAVVEVLVALRDSGEVAFGDGDAKTRPDRLLRDMLAALPAGAVPLGEMTAADGAAGAVHFAAPPGFEVSAEGAKVHEKAMAHLQANPGIDYMDAVRAVSAKR